MALPRLHGSLGFRGSGLGLMWLCLGFMGFRGLGLGLGYGSASAKVRL